MGNVITTGPSKGGPPTDVQGRYSMYGTYGGCDNRGGNTVQKWAFDNPVGGPNSPAYGVVFFKNVMKVYEPSKWGKMWGPYKVNANGELKVNFVGREANDEFSALCVAPNTRVQIWDDADYKDDYMIFEGVNTAEPLTASEPKGYFCFNLSKVPDCPDMGVYNGFNDRTSSFTVKKMRQADSENQLVDEGEEGAPEVELFALLEGLPAEEGYVAGTEGGEELAEEADEAEGPSDLL